MKTVNVFDTLYFDQVFKILYLSILLQAILKCLCITQSISSAYTSALVKTTPHAARGNSAQTRGILQITDATQRANKHKNKLLQQNTWRETRSSKQMDDTPCEVE